MTSAEAAARIETLEAAIRGVVAGYPRGCHVNHASYPVGTTCRDIRQLAHDKPERWTRDFGDEIRAGDHLCFVCRLAGALGARPAAT